MRHALLATNTVATPRLAAERAVTLRPRRQRAVIQLNFAISIKLSLVSSRSELPLKLYDKNGRDLFSRETSSQLYKTVTINSTPMLSQLYNWFLLSHRANVMGANVVRKMISLKEIVIMFKVEKRSEKVQRRGKN